MSANPEPTTLRQVIDPYDATTASNAMIDAAAAQAFRTDDLRGHVKGGWDWDTIPAEGRRDYRALVVAILNAAIAETERQCGITELHSALTARIASLEAQLAAARSALTAVREVREANR